MTEIFMLIYCSSNFGEAYIIEPNSFLANEVRHKNRALSFFITIRI